MAVTCVCFIHIAGMMRTTCPAVMPPPTSGTLVEAHLLLSQGKVQVFFCSADFHAEVLIQACLCLVKMSLGCLVFFEMLVLVCWCVFLVRLVCVACQSGVFVGLQVLVSASADVFLVVFMGFLLISK